MTPEEFRRYGHELIDFIADYRATVADRPVMAPTAPGEIKAQLPKTPPVQPEPFARVLSDLESIVLPGLSHWQHPRFFGYFPSNGLLASVLGDYASTGLGVLGLSWQSSPALTEVEEVVTDWMRQMVDLSDAWSGVIHDTASSATLVALLCAREKTTQYSLIRAGLQAEPKPLVVYMTAHAHSSVDKAALLAGFGRENIHVIPHDDTYAMRPDALRARITEDLAEGFVPCAIVCTVGTTTTTAYDPLELIAPIAQEFGLWLHVDAAMAGSAMILPEQRYLWAGIEGADSLVINPHKWLGVAFDCTLYYVRDPQHLIRVMSTNPSYLRSSVDEQVKNLRDWGLPLGRRFRAMKLWFLIREQGVAGLQARLRRDLDNAEWLAGEIRATTGWTVLAPVVLQTLCVRYEPAGLFEGHVEAAEAAEQLNAYTQAWADRLNRSGAAYLTPAMLDGRWMVRISIGAAPTEREHVAALWAAMKTEVSR
ncbi:MAG: pyridoxal-dependent decarboxylase [Acidobacteriota bacterium]